MFLVVSLAILIALPTVDMAKSEPSNELQMARSRISERTEDVLSASISENNTIVYLRIVPAREIMKKIEEKQPVSYDKAIINGDLDIYIYGLNYSGIKTNKEKSMKENLLNASRVISSPISITRSYINGSVIFGDTTFMDSISFNSTVFKNDAIFMNSSFNSYVFFNNAQLRNANSNRIPSFAWTRFNDNCSFINTTFINGADFRDTEFNFGALFGFADSKIVQH